MRFEHKKAEILKQSLPILEAVEDVLRAHPEIRVEISGHIDASEEIYLQHTYGYHRAKAVRDWLVKRGIDVARMEIKDYGSSRPLLIPKKVEDRAINRRVEFKALPQQP